MDGKYTVYLDNHGITYVVPNGSINLFEATVSVYGKICYSHVVINPEEQMIKARHCKVNRDRVSAFIAKYADLESIAIKQEPINEEEEVNYENVA